MRLRLLSLFPFAVPVITELTLTRAHGDSDLPGFRTLFSERFVWFPFRVDGISPGMQSEVNLYRKYKDFEESGWDIMASVRLLSPLSFFPNRTLILRARLGP